MKSTICLFRVIFLYLIQFIGNIFARKITNIRINVKFIQWKWKPILNNNVYNYRLKKITLYITILHIKNIFKYV